SSRASSSAATSWACCRVSCTAVSACTWSRCSNAGPASRARLRRWLARCVHPCVVRPTIRPCASISRCLPARPNWKASIWTVPIPRWCNRRSPDAAGDPRSVDMPLANNSLHFKITGILLVFFVAAFAAIGLTLFTSWQLKGAAAAINDAGSLRMGTYRIAWLIEQGEGGALAPTTAASRLAGELARFDLVLDGLIGGDPARPLAVP